MSSVDETMRPLWEKMQADSASKRTPAPVGNDLKGGGGGGNSSGGMEARVAKLEADMEHVKKGVDRIDAGVTEVRKTLGDIRVDASNAHGELKASLATLEERTKHFPTRWDVFLIFCAVAAVLAAVVGLAVRFIPPAS